MTIVGAGGVVIRKVRPLASFSQQLVDLPKEISDEVRLVLKELKQNPRPKSLRFEKLDGHKNPDIYTIHATSNPGQSRYELTTVLQVNSKMRDLLNEATARSAPIFC